ncbi:MAG: ABC transporter permease [Thermoleophilia bacterium]
MAAAAVGAAVALPAVYLFIVVAGDWGVAMEAVLQDRTLHLLGRTLLLGGAVALGATAIALPLAWLTVRTDLPARRVWAVLVLLPFVVPSYIGAYLLVSAFGPRGVLAREVAAPLGLEIPSIYGFWGAVAVLTAFTYPLVLLPLRAAMRRMDPSLEEAARGMGASPLRIARSVVFPQLVPAAAAGALLAGLYAMSDFGAVAILRYDSFTRVIYANYRLSFERAGAAALGVMLILVMVVLITLEARLRRRGAYHRGGPGVGRSARPVRLGRWKAPALAFVGMVVMVTLVVPTAVLVWWASRSTGLDVDWAALGVAGRNSLVTAGLTAAIAVVAALPVARLGARHPGRSSRLIDAAHHAGYALPHLVVALALVFMGIRLAPWAYQSLGLAVFGLVVIYIPLAIGALRASLLQVPPSLEEAARGMGRGPLAVAMTVVAPLVRPGVLAAATLVYIGAIKELPAMLLLRPTGYDTLATVIWSETNRSVFEVAAVPSLVLLAVSAPVLAVLVGRER